MASARKSKTSPAPALRVVAGGKAAAAKGASARAAEPGERGKRIKFDLETWHALRQNGITDRMAGFGRLLEEF